MKAAIYARSSTLAQSIDSQVEACKNFVLQHAGTVVHVFSDIGYSGTNLNRPSLIDMINKTGSGEFDTIVTFEYARMSKNKEELEEIISGLNQQKIELLAVKNRSMTLLAE